MLNFNNIIYTQAITLVLVMDPLGNIPIFLSILNAVETKRRTQIIMREAGIAFLILTIFLFGGQYILSGFGITPAGIQAAGGMVLFMIAIKMVFPPNDTNQLERQIGEPFIVPMAIPLIAGPSALATVLLFSSQHANNIFSSFISLIIASFISLGTLLCAGPLRRLLGPKGLQAMERLMGMLLTTIAVQMFLSGVAGYLHLG